MAAPSGKDVSGNVKYSGMYLFSDRQGAVMIRVSYV